MREIGRDTDSTIAEVIIPTDLKTFLTDIADSRIGYRLGEPWKYSEDSLGVVVPILREHTSDRNYVTMYEVLKDLNMKDTGSISQVELQNKSGMAIFVRAGTIFTGKTQNRAAQHSGVYQDEKEIIKVCCVHHSHGISGGSKMEFGDIAPPSITMNLMTGDQLGVWNSVTDYTRGSPSMKRYERQGGFNSFGWTNLDRNSEFGRAYNLSESTGRTGDKGLNSMNIGASSLYRAASHVETPDQGTDNLLGHLQSIKKGQSVIDDMMQKVPLFPEQVGAIIFNPNGVIAVETFDNPKSWTAIKKEIIEKYGDKIKSTQAEHLFELKPEVIPKKFREFIEGLDKAIENIIKKDDFSETREIRGEGIIGEFTIVKGQPIHVLLLKEEKREDNT